MSVKLAIFDVDWTIIKPKSASTFPKDKDDWRWLNSSVPKTINDYFNDGYRIVFWTNQSKPWKRDMINNVIKTLDIDVLLILCYDKSNYKPNADYFWQHFPEDIEIDYDFSFFVGDALGRSGDWSNTDLLAGQAIEINTYPPEEIFVESLDSYYVEPGEKQEVIIMCGYPGSGKSTVASLLEENVGYIVLSGDIYKSSKKMIKEAIQYVNGGYSVIFDSTNMTCVKRAEFVNFAQEHDLNCRCVWIDIDVQTAIGRVANRVLNGGNHVPKIALYKIRKSFEPPTIDEGFELVHL